MNLSPIRRFALSLPDTSEEQHFNYSSFRVRGKIFVTIPPRAETEVVRDLVRKAYERKAPKARVTPRNR